ncbi:pitrilysin family protein [Erwinia sp. HR93]|uniref:M16 family metallopeptidase n=1 Tax=Erwinia sp. HR93 TaxID=3094840 RepID=UPI002ADEA952|nr:pitrilysin family protein [Erwinia sp. HR93]MEA1063020.1 pitrilysin family protein [Erwinia sp. HR93]
MQGKTLALLAGGFFLAAFAAQTQAEALKPDPAWQQGTLDNGLRWQMLSTPHRPNDRIEVRLVVNTGSLEESAQQAGYSRFIPHFALTQNPDTDTVNLWQQATDPGYPQSPATVTYNVTQYALSLPNNRNDLLKEALGWLANTAGKLDISQKNVDSALAQRNAITTWPDNPRDGWWRYRLKGSTLLGHDPSADVQQPVEAESLKNWYQKWYTPDAMTLLVVGNVDARSMIEQIEKQFGELDGKRQMPAPVPTVSPLRREPVTIMTRAVQEDRLTIMWDQAWQPIRNANTLLQYWRADLAREALFLHVQQSLAKNNIRDLQLSFDCHVLFQRAQCSINLDTPNGKLNNHLALVAHNLRALREEGLPKAELDTLIAQKKQELETLFATYARTNTGILMGQRLRALQNHVVDIAPEQYQQLRQRFLQGATPDAINSDLHQLLAQDMALILLQPQGEPEFAMGELQNTWNKIMAPAQSPVADKPETRGEASGPVSH